MFGFSFGKKNSFLGIDIGTSAIKIVELRAALGKPVLSNYAVMPLGNISGDKPSNNDESFDWALSDCIKRMMKEAGFETDLAYVSLPAFGGLITLIEFPKMAENEMGQAIRFEAHKYIPSSLDDVVLSWDIVGGGSGEISSERTDKDGENYPGSSEYHKNREKTEILLVAASRNKVVRYEKIIKNAGLNLQSMELEGFSMASSLVGNNPGRFIIVDMGSRICNIIFVEDGVIKMSRNIDAGGKDITNAIAKGMEIDNGRAETLKISKKNFFEPSSSINFPVVDVILGEISRIIASAGRDGEKRGIDKIVLSGGTAGLFGLSEHLSRSLGREVVVGDPFFGIDFDSSLEKEIREIGVQFSVCVGLALKGVREFNKNKK